MAEIENIEAIEKIAEKRVDADSAVRKLNALGLRDMTKGMSADEKADVVAVMDTEVLVNEVSRREQNVNKILKELTDFLATSYDKSMNVVEKQNVITRVREIVKI